MAISLKTTGSLSANGVKLLVYGQAGAGKTSLIKTLPSPIVLSAEGGLLSIQDADLPFIEITNMETLKEAYTWLTETTDYKSVALDSISEIAEVCLNYEKKINKDPRAAYGAMQEQMADIIRASSRPGGVVLDCFMGSGVTGEAAVRLGREFIGMESDPGHFGDASTRIRAASFQVPTSPATSFDPPPCDDVPPDVDEPEEWDSVIEREAA